MDDDQAQWNYTGGGSESESSQELTESFTWTASEYIEHEKSSLWYAGLVLGGIIVSVIVYFISDGDKLTTATILIITMTLVFFASRKPKAKTYEISSKGLTIDGKLFSFADFKSFSVVEEGAIESIWLKSLGRFSPMIIIYFAPEEGGKIADLLSNYLPHEQRELDIIDRALKRLRF